MKLRLLGAALLAAAMGTTAQAVPVTVNLSANAPFSNSTVTDTTGSLSGSFVVDDNGDGTIVTGEITEFSITASGFSRFADFTISSASGGLVGVSNISGLVDIGGGLSLGSITFDDSAFFNEFIKFDLVGPGGAVAVPFAAVFTVDDPDFAVLKTSDFSVNDFSAGADVSSIPLPAPLAMMVGGLAAFGFVARRKRSKAYLG